MRRVLIVAPHPDDETLCCGGTIQIFKEKGYKISVIIVTDGRYGSPDDKLKGSSELIEIRRQEALRATKILGIDEVKFLNFEDSKVSEEDAENALAEFLRENDVVFSPIPFDNHPDHANIGKAVEKLYPNAYFYLIWGNTQVNWREVKFDIRKYKESKLRAINQYISQIGGLPLERFTGDYEVFWTKG
ncbi:PIG-L deacetylase family protein [Saccharolobus solfataricus]|nr:PIG-L deacetylase family protein [Saccharolobus solfataricus]